MMSIAAAFVSATLLLAGVSADSAFAQQTPHHSGATKGIKLTDIYQLTGTITAVEDNKLGIYFDEGGDKKVMDAYVRKA